MNLFPMFLKLDGRRCLVVGAGSVAEAKIASLLQSGAEITVVAPLVRVDVRSLATAGRIRLIEREFQASDLENMFVVIAATSDSRVNHAVFSEAQRRGILCNAVDDPPNCDFFFPAVVRRGPLQIAVSTAGESPALAQSLRMQIEEQLDAHTGAWLEKLGEVRREVLATLPAGEERKQLLKKLSTREICDHTECPSRKLIDEAIREKASQRASKTKAEPGKVYLVGAGPGDPELLTRKAAALLETADIILHDDLVPKEILAMAGPSTLVANVGKRCGKKRVSQAAIHGMMIDSARKNLRVVRLKSGDPLIFGRAGEELHALQAAGVPCGVVPGITAAFAAAAAAGFSLTDRRAASGVIFATGHLSAEGSNVSPEQQRQYWQSLAQPNTTVVIYMPGQDLARLSAQMLAAGFASESPCRLISRAGTPQQQQRQGTLATLDQLSGLPAPSILFVGEVTADVEALLSLPVEVTDVPSLESLMADGDEAVPEDLA